VLILNTHTLQAAALLEAAVRCDSSRAPQKVPAAWLKNLGLAYMQLVRADSADPAVPPRVQRDPLQAHQLLPWYAANGDTSDSGSGSSGGWKDAASKRFVEAWGLFLQHKDAGADSQFESVQRIYGIVTAAAAGATQRQ
jgi:hypothetical protein